MKKGVFSLKPVGAEKTARECGGSSLSHGKKSFSYDFFQYSWGPLNLKRYGKGMGEGQQVRNLRSKTFLLTTKATS